MGPIPKGMLPNRIGIPALVTCSEEKNFFYLKKNLIFFFFFFNPTRKIDRMEDPSEAQWNMGKEIANYVKEFGINDVEIDYTKQNGIRDWYRVRIEGFRMNPGSDSIERPVLVVFDYDVGDMRGYRLDRIHDWRQTSNCRIEEVDV